MDDYFARAVEAKNRLQDYAGAWRAVGCSCNNCPTCDDRYLTPEKAEEIAEFIHFLALHAGALEHQMKFMIESVKECREFAIGFPGMSRNNAEQMAYEMVEKLNAADPTNKES